jgi:hypothetical protein
MPATTGGEVIKEFVVSIKYVVDDSSLAKSEDNITAGFKAFVGKTGDSSKILKGILDLSLLGFSTYAIGVGGALGGIAKAIDSTMKTFTGFYYTAQQLNSTFKVPIQDLMEIQLQSQLAGLGVNGLTDQLLAVSKALRDQPKDALLKQIIGNETDPEKALHDLAKWYNSLTKQQQYAERSLLSTLNIDPDIIRQLGQNLNQTAPYIEQYHKTLTGLNLGTQGGAKNAVDLQRQLDTLDAQMQATLADFTLKSFPTLIHLLGQLNDYISTHTTQINGLADQLPHAFDQLTHFIQSLVDFGNKTAALLNMLGYSSGALQPHDKTEAALAPGGVTAQINKIPAAIFGPWIKLFSDTFKSNLSDLDQNKQEFDKQAADRAKQDNAWIKTYIWDPMHTWLTGVTQSPNVEIAAADGIWPIFLNWLRGVGSYIPFVQLKPKSGSTQTALEDQVQTLAKALEQSLGISPATGPATPQEKDQLPANAGQKIGSKQEDLNIQKAVAFFESKGLTKDQSVGVVARLDAESNLNPNAVNPLSGAYGIAQWLGSRRSAATQTGGDLNKQLELIWHEMNSTENAALTAIKTSKTAPDAARAMEQYERAKDPAFTQYAASLTNFVTKQLHTAFGIIPEAKATEYKPASHLDKTNQHQAAPNLDPLHNLGKHIINGLAPISGMGNTHYAFSPHTEVHVHGVNGPEIGSKVAKAVGRTNSTLYRNFYSQVT